MSTILKAENISKQYRLGKVGSGTISDDLKRWWHNVRGLEDPFLKVGGVNDRSSKATEDYVWALRDINFEVKTGEVLGIIGRNGAGKTTLLKILSRVTSPTTGSIKTRGRIASLLEVGTGFHGELTGRENIFMNAAILGMTKSEVRAKIDEIIDFSGCEQYIDTPVKRYSSGMTVRLGFAVAAHLEPEILVVDEVLAVGDAEFQKKAIGKMQDLSQGQGRTVLFVSHNMGSVKKLCSRGLLLDNGTVSFQGNVEDTLSFYQNTYSDDIDLIFTGNKIIKKASLNSDNNIFKYRSELILDVFIEVNDFIKKLVLGIVIKDLNDIELVGVNNRHYHKNKINSDDVKKGRITLTIGELKLLPGIYKIDLYLGDTITDLEVVRDAMKFEVIESYENDLMKDLNFNINKIIHDEITWQYTDLL